MNCAYDGCQKPGRVKLEIGGFIILYCRKHYLLEQREHSREARKRNQ